MFTELCLLVCLFAYLCINSHPFLIILRDEGSGDGDGCYCSCCCFAWPFGVVSQQQVFDFRNYILWLLVLVSYFDVTSLFEVCKCFD